EMLVVLEFRLRILRVRATDQRQGGGLGEGLRRTILLEEPPHARHLEDARPIHTAETRDQLSGDLSARAQRRAQPNHSEQLLDERRHRKGVQIRILLARDYDDAEPLGFDTKFVVVEMHRAREELVELRHVWRMERL